MTKPNGQLGQDCRKEIELPTSSKSYNNLKVYEKEQVSAIDKNLRFRRNKKKSAAQKNLVTTPKMKEK